MYNDTISDFLTRFRNALMADKKDVRVRSNKVVERLAEIFKDKGYVASITKDGYHLDLVLNDGIQLSMIKRLSKPGIRRYVKYTEIPRPNSGFGMIVVSTPKGVMTGNQARKQKVGGELICEVW